MKASGAFIEWASNRAADLKHAVNLTKAWDQRSLSHLRSGHDDATARAQSRYVKKLAHLRRDLAELTTAAGLSVAPWDEPGWQEYSSVQNQSVPPAIRVGTLAFPERPDVEFPALLRLLGGQGLIIKAAGGMKDAAAEALQSVVLRLFATVPAGEINALFIDPVGIGQNAARFMELSDHREELVSGMAQSEPSRIESELAALTDHMSMVIQKYLRGRYETIEDHNVEAKEIAEPYRIVVVFDFPVNFSEESARRLINIAANGPRCGVYVLASMDTEHRLPHDFNETDLDRVSTVLVQDGSTFVREEESYRGAKLTLDKAPASETFQRVIESVGPLAVEAARVEVPFERIMPAEGAWWTADTRSGIKVPIGRYGANQILELSLGGDMAQHCLLAGRTASGKSTLLHALITNLSVTYSPEQLELYLVDFKKGVEFKDYATYGLPHARVIAIETEREFGMGVLSKLNAELEHRAELFRSAGCGRIGEYRERVKEPLPRILLIVDEFQEFFTEDDSLAHEAGLLLDRLARQGQGFGIHLLLASQTLAGAYSLHRSTMEQMAARIALQCSEADSRVILGADNPAARWLSRPGEAYYNAAGGMPDANTRFQVAWLPQDKREDILSKVRTRASETIHDHAPPIIFEGNAAAAPETNQPLGELLARQSWPKPEKLVSAWLGEPIAIKEPTRAKIGRQSGRNLVIVGRDEGAAVGMLSMAMISIASQQSTSTARFYVADLTAMDEPWHRFCEFVANAVPHTSRIASRGEIPDVVEELAAIIHERAADPGPGNESIYLVIPGLQRTKDIRRDEAGYLYDEGSSNSTSRLFNTLITDGPDQDVHVLASCDSIANLERAVDRRGVPEFGIRVALQMTAENSIRLLDDPSAGKLTPHRAIIWDEDAVGVLEKFRPYALPPKDWVNGVGEDMKGRLR